MWSAALAFAVSFGVLLLASLLGAWRPARAVGAAVTASFASAAAFAVAWSSGSETIVDVPWVPALGSRLHLALDPLAAPLVVFATSLAGIVLLYTGAYLPHHLEKHGSERSESARFCRLMLGFVAAMVLLLTAQDLVVVFVALELTALASYCLIGFDQGRAARRAADVALLVTVGSSMLFLVGTVLAAVEADTTHVGALATHGVSTTTAVCLTAGVLAKSAQVPLHFWLPRAMVAPTPVSAYLHSAALVAAGVFVLQRVRPLVEPHPILLDGLLAVGLASIAVGGALAFVADRLKRILAYSTIAQYGYAVVLIALGGSAGAVGAPFFLLAHGLCKCALFMTAGTVTEATGSRRLSDVRGALRRMPALAIASGVAAVGLAGAPATVGYLKDESLFAAALHAGPLLTGSAVAAAALTVAYTLRFWLGLVRGEPRVERVERLGARWTLPVGILALLVLVGGVWTAPLDHVFGAAGDVVAGSDVSFELALHLGARPETWMALGAWAGGALLLLLRAPIGAAISRTRDVLAPLVGPAAIADRVGAWTGALSDRLHDVELRDLRDRVSIVVFVTAGFLGVGAFAASGDFRVDGLRRSDTPVAAALLVTGLAAVLTARAVPHVTMILLLSFVGFGLALTFALAGAPDVALVVALVESTLTILFLALFGRLPPSVVGATDTKSESSEHGAWAGIVGGAGAFGVAWLALSVRTEPPVERAYLAHAEDAHAKDVVTAILADFRGLDTAVEVTVLAVAVLGAATIRWGRTR